MTHRFHSTNDKEMGKVWLLPQSLQISDQNKNVKMYHSTHGLYIKEKTMKYIIGKH